MGACLIRISSRATGERRYVRVYIYDTVEEMRAAGTRFNGTDLTMAGGVTQAYERHTCDEAGVWTIKQHLIIIRLHRGMLGSAVVSHEINHAATAIYGSTLDPDVKAVDVLHNANETLAYLQSDLTEHLVNRLYELGFY
jgi:hypothetical protein